MEHGHVPGFETSKYASQPIRLWYRIGERDQSREASRAEAPRLPVGHLLRMPRLTDGHAGRSDQHGDGRLFRGKTVMDSFRSVGGLACTVTLAAGRIFCQKCPPIRCTLSGANMAEPFRIEGGAALNLILRNERPDDLSAIRAVNRAAFGRDDEGRLVDALRSAGFVRLSLVAEEEDKVLGHILFTEIKIVGPLRSVDAFVLAPLAVTTAKQRQGIGSTLIREGLRLSYDQGHRIVLVVGHPGYYPRFGFSPELAKPLASPFSGDSFMALELVPAPWRA